MREMFPDRKKQKDSDNLMHVTNTATGNNLTADQCKTIFANA